ncbi:MAG: hypothetical protein DRO40_05770 [Thermoprotei archaeon]|nr:MAG: hypothetical protein DRO40_05770 [Thermoprotei archaeon]
MPTCPYCGKFFRTKRGLKQHIYRSHPFAIETMEKDARKFWSSVDKATRDLFGSRKRRKKRKSSDWWF